MLARKKCSKLLKQCSDLAKQSGKSNILTYSKFLKFQASPNFRQPANHPTIKPGLLGAHLQIFQRLCTVVSDLWISQSAEDSSTVPSSFLLSITGLLAAILSFLCSVKKTQSLLKKVLIKVLISCKRLLVMTSL